MDQRCPPPDVAPEDTSIMRALTPESVFNGLKQRKQASTIIGTVANGSVLTANTAIATTAYMQAVAANVNIQYTVAEGIEIGIPRTAEGRIGVMDLSGIHKLMPCVNGSIKCTAPVSHALGLLLIDGVTHITIDEGKIDAIMNKYLPTRDILSAQDELLDAGFKDHARL